MCSFARIPLHRGWKILAEFADGPAICMIGLHLKFV